MFGSKNVEYKAKQREFSSISYIPLLSPKMTAEPCWRCSNFQNFSLSDFHRSLKKPALPPWDNFSRPNQITMSRSWRSSPLPSEKHNSPRQLLGGTQNSRPILDAVRRVLLALQSPAQLTRIDFGCWFASHHSQICWRKIKECSGFFPYRKHVFPTPGRDFEPFGNTLAVFFTAWDKVPTVDASGSMPFSWESVGGEFERRNNNF